MLNEIYQTYFYQPIFKFLEVSFLFFKDFGFSIFFLTLLLRILLLPLNIKMQKEQKKMETISRIIKDLQSQYKNNKDELTKHVLEIFKKEKINPLPIYLFFLIQFPVFLAIYQSLKEFSLRKLPLFLGILDLTKPNFFIAFLAGVLQYIQISSNQTIQMTIALISSIFLILIFSELPSALALYLLFMVIFNFIEKLILSKFLKMNKVETRIEIKKKNINPVEISKIIGSGAKLNEKRLIISETIIQGPDGKIIKINGPENEGNGKNNKDLF
jgi:YidC/Oxa1 family membrane protein insertase